MSVDEPPAEEIPPARVAAGVFEDWQRLLTEALAAHGADPGCRAPVLASVVVASVEGAIVRCRAQRSMLPLDRVARKVETLLTDAVTRTA
ncbi:hypothetical protein [Streptomyces sp. NPDC007856]|uniref:LmrA/YxaF family transcription factor n=1 Tax=Streptomyces sp. NPDC007856 TaxID=3364781 RepID=UPI00368CCAC0